MKSLLTTILVFLTSFASQAGNNSTDYKKNFNLSHNGNDILGHWRSAHGSGKIEIYKKGEKFFGKLIWLKTPNDENGKPLTDIKNPDEALRNRPIMGLEIFRDLAYKGNNTWGGGTVYDPKSGKTYNCQMSLQSERELDIRAFFGIALIGKTETWTRVD
ncbi:DUF2147 domain-containing protein [Desertivirga xinjiangensis]|uniref:DUF2147 domain-containing protein n=1 Tax=Desertivirga xinjiangensis TaxID=539206 RepID=UPI00210C412E|nr:DUF2147 domain-containing protein [Pedobacter xinjiangensis]